MSSMTHMTHMVHMTFPSARVVKVDCLSDYERRELDCWIAETIEQYEVLHDATGVKLGSMIRLSDMAYRDFLKEYPNHTPTCTGPYPVPYYSFNPIMALNCFQTTEYSEGWTFTREYDKWQGMNAGLRTYPCKSFALCLMLALRQEYEYQNQKENPDAMRGPGPSVS
ncbi:hypothetical protein LCGC14_3045960 [marine sediment metagenome]|uniref:Uncharacterized protein n=1 Tax=marine sediment metagenome TaxID=412755 RepID=A0A0F8ZE26_9ZZZZ